MRQPEIELKWRKSSRSQHMANCVEAALVAGGVAVRDSKDREGTVLSFAAADWSALVDSIKQA